MGKKVVILCLVLLSSCSDRVDLIVHNASIFSADESYNSYSSLAVKDGKFVYVGGDEIFSNYTSSNVINAQELPIYPGFIDSHAHFYDLGYYTNQVDLKNTNSLDEILERLQEFNIQNNPSFIIGRGWDQNDWTKKSLPSNDVLNKAFPDKPVILRRIDGHAYLVNDFVLDLAGIDLSTKVNGGEIIIDRGKLTGVLIDNSMNLVDNIIPEPTKDEAIKALLSAQEIAFKNGLTTISDAGLTKNQIDLIDELHQDGILKIRMYAMIQNDSSSINHFLKTGPYKTDRLNVRSVKVYVDGALGSRGALLIDDYSDRKGHKGIIVTPIDSISSLAFKLAGTKFQMNTHAIGDRANRIVLNAYRDALFDYRDPRWRIEHAQVISEDDIDLFNYKIIPSVQPTHATSDMYWLYDRIGKKRAENAYAYKSLLNKSNVIALGTDFPVEDVSPIMTFYSAVVRKDINEYPEDGFQTENALSRLEALIGMTRHGAYANFEENEKGSIEVGKFADFIILDNDLLNIQENRIPNTKIVATFVNGELVFNRRFN